MGFKQGVQNPSKSRNNTQIEIIGLVVLTCTGGSLAGAGQLGADC